MREKYDLLPSFWKLCEQQFGYTDAKPTLEKLIVTMFVTSTARQLGCEVPTGWKSFVSYKSGNIIAFLDNLMNSVLYSGRFDELSKHVSDGLNTMLALYRQKRRHDISDRSAHHCEKRRRTDVYGYCRKDWQSCPRIIRRYYS